MTTSESLRTLAIILLAASFAAWLMWSIRSPQRLYAVPVLLWIANAGTFLAARALDAQFSIRLFNNWSLGVYIQAGITLVGIGFYAWLKKVEPRSGY